MKTLPFFKQYPGPLLFAHRGYSSRMPENTLAAFSEAAREGVPGVELDIHLVEGGELVVFHDDNLKRICGVDKIIETCSLTQIRELDAGIWKGAQFKNEKIPLLTELFELLGTRVYCDIEIKSRSTKESPLEETLKNQIYKYGIQNHCIVSSFNPFRLKFFKKLCPEIPAAVIYCVDSEVPWFLRKGAGRYLAPTEILKPKHDLVNREKLRRQKNPSRLTLPWTVDDFNLAKELLECGVDGLISNDPGPLKKLYR